MKTHWNRILQIICTLHEAKDINKKVCNNAINSINLQKKDTILKKSENSKTSDPHKLLLNLPDKTKLKRTDKHVALSNLSNISMRKYQKA